ncbi:MAG: DUF1203 domain-containing protein [Acidobacteria bacterium]|nr:DUF1203 domain-containing protein [Acidobacteriota bacterium]
MTRTFQIEALTKETFNTDQMPSEWVIAKGYPGYPCRVSLQDAQPGERVLLVHYTHHAVSTPYRAAGPIYIREQAENAQFDQGVCPPFFQGRQLSMRAYTHKGYLANARVCEGVDASDSLNSLFENPKVAYVHIHFAAPGCYCCTAVPVEAGVPA